MSCWESNYYKQAPSRGLKGLHVWNVPAGGGVCSLTDSPWNPGGRAAARHAGWMFPYHCPPNAWALLWLRLDTGLLSSGRPGIGTFKVKPRPSGRPDACCHYKMTIELSQARVRAHAPRPVPHTELKAGLRLLCTVWTGPGQHLSPPTRVWVLSAQANASQDGKERGTEQAGPAASEPALAEAPRVQVKLTLEAGHSP